MARQDLGKLLVNLDRFAASATQIGPIRAAEKIIEELQQAGPAWSGEFSNSWQITGPQNQTAKGTGAPGRPVPVRFKGGPFTGPQALFTAGKRFALKDKTVFKISNFSSHAFVAMDLEESTYIDPGITPIKPVIEGIRIGGYRGDLSRQSDGPNRATAPLDWYTNYVRGGNLDRTVQLTLDRELGRVRL